MYKVDKHFGGIHALKEFSLQIPPGKILALVGENGAGKSTVARILSGAEHVDSGLILIDGKIQSIYSPRKGKELGVSMIYQEFALAQDLSVAENIFLGSMGKGRGLINWKELYSRASEITNMLGLDIDPKSRVGTLSVAYQQIVEIAKALSENSQVLILDEPTAVLPPQDVERLFEILERLKKRDVSIIYISDRLEEVFKIADLITVLRDGQITGSFNREDTNINQVINLMVGRELTGLFPKRENHIGNVVMRVENFCAARFRNISFEVRRGEVVGFAGLVGSGRTELARAIFGADKKQEGTLFVNSSEITVDSPKAAIRHGIAMVPESRKTDGLVLPMSVKENISITNLNKIRGPLGWLNMRLEKKIATDLINSIGIKTPSINTSVYNLSGGNQQKVVLAKWFNTESSIIIFDEPTRGVDVGAKVEIYNLINNCAASGLGVIMISSEMVELIGMCDRVCVFNNGEIRKELTGADISEQNIINVIMERRAS